MEKTMAKYITRTFHVHEGKKLEANFETMTFDERPVILIDCEELPKDFKVEKEYNCKVRMPIENFFNSGERITIND